MTHVKQKPSAGPASTATMARLRSAVANSARRRDSERVEPDDDVEEPPMSGRVQGHEDDTRYMTTGIQSEAEADDHFDRLAELRLMARRLADQSKAGGDLRRTRVDGNWSRDPSEFPADDRIAARPAQPVASRTASRKARTVEPIHAADELEGTDPVTAGAAAPDLEDGAAIRDRLSLNAPPSGFEHDAAEVLRADAKKRSLWPVFAASASVIVAGLAYGASMMLSTSQPMVEPTRRAELAAEPPSAVAEIASRPELPVASPARDHSIAVNVPEPAVEQAPPPQVAIQPPQLAEPVPVAAPVPAPVTVPVPAPTRSVRLTPAELRQVQNLMASGRTRVAAGDVAGARAIYQRAADIGDGPAAFALAETYDPAALARPGVQGIKPDPSTARHWYQTAADRGLAEARVRLERMPSR